MNNINDKKSLQKQFGDIKGSATYPKIMKE